jgi:L-fuculose-phosphate aldolase
MHLEVYRQRPDVHAVVHAHPPTATAFSIAGVSLARCVIPEVIVTLGSIHTAEYATPGTDEVSASIRQSIQDYDAIILTHHGSLTVGRSLWEAYLRLEKVEHTAQITLAAQQLGQVQTLPADAVEKLAAKRRELLQREGRDVCEGCSICLLGDEYSPAARSLDNETTVQQITQAVINNVEKELLRR